MKRLLPILVILLFNCKAVPDSSTAIEIKEDCLDKEMENAIKQGVLFFESKLKEKYPTVTLERAYFDFLYDIREKKIDARFFLNTNLQPEYETIKNLNIWDISERSMENMERERILFNVDSMPPTRVKLSKGLQLCLAKKIKYPDDLGIRAVLSSNAKYRIGPRTATRYVFRNTSETDLKKYSNRMVLSLIFYYQTAFNLIH